MARMGYREALAWVLVNDDDSWLDHEGSCSVAAGFLADMFRKQPEAVIADLRRMRDKAKAGDL